MVRHLLVRYWGKAVELLQIRIISITANKVNNNNSASAHLLLWVSVSVSVSVSSASSITYNKIDNKRLSISTHLLLWDRGKVVELWIAPWPQHHQEAKEPLTFSLVVCLFFRINQHRKYTWDNMWPNANVWSDWLTEIICIFVPFISSG